MTTSSAVPALQDALLAVANSAFGLASPVDVTLGPGNMQDDTGQQIWIGATGPGIGEMMEAATSDWVWPYADHHFRREDFTIHCMATAWSGDDLGDDAYQTLRDQCYAQIDALTAAILLDPSLGGAVLQVNSVTAGTLSWMANEQGVEAHVAFDVNAMQQFQD